MLWGMLPGEPMEIGHRKQMDTKKNKHLETLHMSCRGLVELPECRHKGHDRVWLISALYRGDYPNNNKPGKLSKDTLLAMIAVPTVYRYIPPTVT